MIDTLYEHPVLGATGALGGWIGSLMAITPLFQFIAAFTGAIIGLVTVWGLMIRFYKWMTV